MIARVLFSCSDVEVELKLSCSFQFLDTETDINFVSYMHESLFSCSSFICFSLSSKI
jgi:hypothetical protein